MFVASDHDNNEWGLGRIPQEAQMLTLHNWTLNLLGSGSSNLIRIEIIDTTAISYMLRKIPAPVVVIRSSPASSSFVSDEKKCAFISTYLLYYL